MENHEKYVVFELLYEAQLNKDGLIYCAIRKVHYVFIAGNPN